MEPDEQNPFVDTWLDEALRQHGAIEPRRGLEDRILAHLRAESHRTVRTARWWPVLATAAAVLLVTAVFMSTQHHRSPGVVVSHPAIPQSLHRDDLGNTSPLVAKVTRRHALRNTGTPQRQEQFPSPQPLSEQERILARYVEQFPRDAALIAQAQTELFQQEMPEQEIPGEEIPPISDQPNP